MFHPISTAVGGLGITATYTASFSIHTTTWSVRKAAGWILH